MRQGSCLQGAHSLMGEIKIYTNRCENIKGWQDSQCLQGEDLSEFPGEKEYVGVCKVCRNSVVGIWVCSDIGLWTGVKK